MRPGVLGGLGWLLVVPALYVAACDSLTLRSLRDLLRGADALNEELDASLACDLAKDFVKQSGSYSMVLCQGELVVSGDVARLSNVQVNWNPHTYCFARTPGWQVLRSDRGIPCFGSPPPDLSRPLESEHERLMQAATTQLNERLDGVRRAMASEVRPSKCTTHRRSSRGDVPVLEFELLQSGDGAASWSFLSTPWLREAVVKRDEPSLLAATEHWRVVRPWVAVVTSSARTEPHGGSIITPWARGSLSGTMTLIDAEAGTLLCEAPFSFESSMTIERPAKHGKGRINIEPIVIVHTEAEVRGDFMRRYESAATRTLNEMTGYDAWPAFH